MSDSSKRSLLSNGLLGAAISFISAFSPVAISQDSTQIQPISRAAAQTHANVNPGHAINSRRQDYAALPLCANSIVAYCKDMNGNPSSGNNCTAACLSQVNTSSSFGSSGVCPNNYVVSGIYNTGTWLEADGPHAFVTFPQLIAYWQNGYNCYDMVMDLPINPPYGSNKTETDPYCHGDDGIWTVNQEALPGSYVSENASIGYVAVHVTGHSKWGNSRSNLCGYYVECYRSAGYYTFIQQPNMRVPQWVPVNKQYAICSLTHSIWKSPNTPMPAGCPGDQCNW